MSQLLKDLKAIRWLLNDKSSWTKRAAARDKHSHPCDPNSEKATRWCLVGAHQYIIRNDNFRTDNISRTLHRLTKGNVSFNDSPLTKHQDVLDMLDKAIERTTR